MNELDMLGLILAKIIHVLFHQQWAQVNDGKNKITRLSNCRGLESDLYSKCKGLESGNTRKVSGRHYRF